MPGPNPGLPANLIKVSLDLRAIQGSKETFDTEQDSPNEASGKAGLASDNAASLSQRGPFDPDRQATSCHNDTNVRRKLLRKQIQLSRRGTRTYIRKLCDLMLNFGL